MSFKLVKIGQFGNQGRQIYVNFHLRPREAQVRFLSLYNFKSYFRVLVTSESLFGVKSQGGDTPFPPKHPRVTIRVALGSL